jgi:hypothetical protein
MPNHVTTRCFVTGSQADVDQFRNRAFRLQGISTLFDFNAFIPMPSILTETQSGSVAEQGAALVCLLRGRAPPTGRSLFGPRLTRMQRTTIAHTRKTLDMPKASIIEVAKAWLEKHPKYRDQGEKRLQAIEETGFADWYDWSTAHWGTKWNAYLLHIHSERPLEFSFNTAWEFPLPVFAAIVEAFPRLSIRCSCYDEGDSFAGDGYLNPRPGQPEFALCEATDELYELVYGGEPKDGAL